jgi:hypothetical protein
MYWLIQGFKRLLGMAHEPHTWTGLLDYSTEQEPLWTIDYVVEPKNTPETKHDPFWEWGEEAD